MTRSTGRHSSPGRSIGRGHRDVDVIVGSRPLRGQWIRTGRGRQRQTLGHGQLVLAQQRQHLAPPDRLTASRAWSPALIRSFHDRRSAGSDTGHGGEPVEVQCPAPRSLLAIERRWRVVDWHASQSASLLASSRLGHVAESSEVYHFRAMTVSTSRGIRRIRARPRLLGSGRCWRSGHARLGRDARRYRHHRRPDGAQHRASAPRSVPRVAVACHPGHERRLPGRTRDDAACRNAARYRRTLSLLDRC